MEELSILKMGVLWPTCLCLPNLYVEILMSSVMIFGSEAFGLGNESEALMNRISVLVK